MKTIGIVGGLGPEATVDYYKRIIEAFRVPGSLAAPEIVIYSVSLEEVFELVGKREWTHLVYMLGQKIKALQRAGADFAVISANTPHVVFDDLRAKSPIPLISIVTATLEKAKELGLKKPALLGTKFTMEENFFADPFAAEGMTIVVPSQDDQAYIQRKLVDEIELGVFTDDTRAGLLAIVKRMLDEEGIDGVILGCTELPLILEKDEFGIPFLNTTAIHVESIKRYCA